MNIFISWSGDLSKAVALAFRDWLKLVIHGSVPFVSDEDIAKGTRGLFILSQELERSDLGLLCITRQNYDRPWINFEAGAISKKVGQAKAIPFLVDLQAHDLPRNSPLTQFQAALNTRADIHRMVHSINRAVDPKAMDDEVLDTLFSAVWDKLEHPIQTAMQAQAPDLIPVETNTPQEMLAEVLDLARNQYRELDALRDMVALSSARHLVFMDEVPPMPDDFVNIFPPDARDSESLMRVLTKFYYAFGKDRQITPSEFLSMLKQLVPLLRDPQDATDAARVSEGPMN